MANPAENTLLRSACRLCVRGRGRRHGALRPGPYQRHVLRIHPDGRRRLRALHPPAHRAPPHSSTRTSSCENIVGVTDYLRDLIEKNGGDAGAGNHDGAAHQKRRGIFHRQRGRRMARVSLCGRYAVPAESSKRRSCSTLPPRRSANFQRMLKDYPADTLFETIEKFHDTENRLANFEKALAADKLRPREETARQRSRSQWPMRRIAAVALEAAARRQAAPARDAQRHQTQQHPHRQGHRRGHLRH